MSAQHGCNDDMVVVENFKEALKQRVGAERFQMWFAHGIQIEIDSAATRLSDSHHTSANGVANDNTLTEGETPEAEIKSDARSIVMVRVRGQFALDRLRKNFLRELRGAAMQACGSTTNVELCLDEPPAEQADLPLGDLQPGDGREVDESRLSNQETPTRQSERPMKPSRQARQRTRGSRRGKAKSISTLIADGAGVMRSKTTMSGRPAPAATPAATVQPKITTVTSAGGMASSARAKSNPKQLDLLAKAESNDFLSSASMTVSNFVLGPSNQLAHTAMAMVSQNPAMASPLFLCGPTGTGKTHMLAAIADQLRRRHRMRRVMHLSAEQFTNDFISSVGNSGITSFRRRYREVDALLIDDVQFLGSKQATLRELLYTVETLGGAGRPLVFSGLQSPTEIPGLSSELAGRMAAGLVCPIQPLDMATREVIFRRWIEDRCPFTVPDPMIEQIISILSGDGRVISGVVNLVNTLQRMLGRVPSMEELRRFGGELLRAAKPVATLSVIEMAVCEAFQLSQDTLRGGSQTRAVSQPRMLAMYLSRQLTSSAYTEIARHFGGKSHSTAISAENNVKTWLQQGKSIGRGHAAMSAQEAIDRVESLLRSG